MPAQQMHVLKNPAAADGSPWYPAAFDGELVTPEWTFAAGALTPLAVKATRLSS